METRTRYYRLRSAFRMCLHLGRIGYGPMEAAWSTGENIVSNAVVDAVAHSMPLAVSYPGQLPKENRWAGLAHRRHRRAARLAA